ncbi:response regulator [Bdellovibrio sp. SKB1291214]|uniref:response regulator n=1 Tax=Bdellovibrio sp. SKB1291214 TaxID=1732569 RepID=UPI000B51B986|nr:response regulator [Bdellovibrio sp. SKB1291214]UYL07425.1 response regulator [Bdellovibrio sp. SKB1291214]
MDKSTKKILVVDDTDGNRYALARNLKTEGYSVVEAVSGYEALRLIESEMPDLVTLDIHLPDINGFEVCRRIKLNPMTSHIPVLQVSASYVTSKARIMGLEGGADNYLTHPIEPPVLHATVLALLRTRQLMDDLRSAQIAQAESLSAAKLANQAKSRFLSNMSHEIRTPLGVIQGFADLALEPGISEEERQSYLHTIKKNAISLTSLIGEILDLAKVEAGKMEIETIRFSLTQTLNEVVESFNLRANEKGLTLKLHTAEHTPEFINSDPTKFRQILVNLVGNALKFTEKGLVEINVGLTKNRNYLGHHVLEVKVKDSGIGLSKEQQGKLFEAFVQADSSTTRKFGGTGLGLNLSKKLAQSLGGDLYLYESSEGLGSTFGMVIDIGLIKPEDYLRPKTSSEGVKIENSMFSGMRVLLVEDIEDNQLLFSNYLRNLKASVDVAGDGMIALSCAEKNQYDVILMDIQMPNLDGYQTLKALRERGDNTPAIALTANALKEEREIALNLGFVNYLTKPLSAKTLVAALKEIQLQL